MRRLTCAHVAQGCCDECRRVRRRRANTEGARQRRLRDLAARSAGAKLCPKRFGSSLCGGRLETDVDRQTGRTVISCPRCDRTARGVCLDCPAPVYGKAGKARRCANCARLLRNACTARWAKAHTDVVRAKMRERREDPTTRARDLEYKRLWRKTNREKVRAQKRRSALRQLPKVLSYQKRRRKKYGTFYQELYKARRREAREARGTPLCTKCSKPVVWHPTGPPPKTCDACCWPHQLRARLAKREAYQAKLTAAGEVGTPAVPVKVRRPAGRKEVDGHRLCLGEGCDRVVTGRKKKCTACKEREQCAAAAHLASRPRRRRAA